MTQIFKLAVPLLLFVLTAFTSHSTEITIWGQGHAEPLGNHPQTTVEVFDKSDMTLLGSTITDENGDYNVTLLFAGTGGIPDKVEESARLIQNPSGDEVNVILSSNADQNWQVMVYDDAGRLICNQNIHLASGTSGVKISRLGVAGMKTIVLKGISNQYALKAVLSQTAPLSPRVEVTSTSRILKSVSVGDSLYILFTPPEGFIGMDTTVVMTSQTVNYVLQQIPNEYNYVVYAYSITDGSPVIDSTALKISWGDGTSTVYYADNGLLHIQHSTYDTTQNVFIENGDTSYYQEWIFGVKRENLITTKELNLFQNEKVQSPGPIGEEEQYIYPTPAPANLSMLPDTFEVYFVPTIVFDSEDQPWDTRGMTFRKVVATRCDPVLWVKKWEIGQWDTTYLYEMQLFENTMNLITPEQSLAQEIALDSMIAQGFYLRANGRQLFPNYKRVKIYTMTEPEYLAGEAREWDQIHVAQYGNNNENGCSFTSDSTFSGYWRFKGAIGNYTLTSNRTYKMAELIESFTHCSDPIYGNLGGKVVFADGHMTTFGLTTVHMIYFADPATIFW